MSAYLSSFLLFINLSFHSPLIFLLLQRNRDKTKPLPTVLRLHPLFLLQSPLPTVTLVSKHFLFEGNPSMTSLVLSRYLNPRRRPLARCLPSTQSGLTTTSHQHHRRHRPEFEHKANQLCLPPHPAKRALLARSASPKFPPLIRACPMTTSSMS